MLMMMPTYGMAYGSEDGRFVNSVHWYDFLLVAYLDVVPIISLICGIVMTVGLLVGVVRQRIQGWVAIPGIAAAVLLVTFSYDRDHASFVIGTGQCVAPILAVAAALVIIVRRLEGRSAT